MSSSLVLYRYKVTHVAGTAEGRVAVGDVLIDSDLPGLTPGDPTDGWRQWNIMRDGDPQAGVIVADLIGPHEPAHPAPCKAASTGLCSCDPGDEWEITEP